MLGKHISSILIAVTVFMTTQVIALDGTYDQCDMDCLPGVNACSSCCYTRYTDVVKSDTCTKKAREASLKCEDDRPKENSNCYAAYNKCVAKNDKYNSVVKCITTRDQCFDNVKKTFDEKCPNVIKCPEVLFDISCPGSVPEQECPYTCQSWNPASKSCVGPTLNGC
jgi:hypothetical protein